jgi:hypothetical protein
VSADLRPDDEPVTVLPVGRLADADDGEPGTVLVLPVAGAAVTSAGHRRGGNDDDAPGSRRD